MESILPFVTQLLKCRLRVQTWVLRLPDTNAISPREPQLLLRHVSLVLSSTHFNSLHQSFLSLALIKPYLTVVKLEINVHVGPRQEKMKSATELQDRSEYLLLSHSTVA